MNLEKIDVFLDEKVVTVDATFVKEKSGYTIGGVPSFAHKEKMITFIDRNLLNYKRIWAAAGHPQTLFQMPSDALVEITGG